MAVDNSPLKMHVIALTAVIGLGTLIGLKFVFDSYYTTMFEEEEYVKVGSVAPKELLALHSAEAKSFAAAPVPLDKAMQLVARGRNDPAVNGGAIVPQPSTDRAALIGWALTAKTDSLDEGADAPPAGSASAAVAPGAPSASGAPPPPSASASPGAAPSGSAMNHNAPNAPGSAPPPALPTGATVASARLPVVPPPGSSAAHP